MSDFGCNGWGGITMDKKTIIVILLGVVAAAIFYYAYSSMEVLNNLTFLKRELNSSKFEENFLKYNCSAIIMDIRGIEDPYRKNIVMCGIDLSGSMGIMGRETQIMSFDENGCVEGESGNKTVQECMSMLRRECYIFYITKGENTSKVYDGLLIIGEGDVYSPCIISYSVS